MYMIYRVIDDGAIDDWPLIESSEMNWHFLFAS